MDFPHACPLYYIATQARTLARCLLYGEGLAGGWLVLQVDPALVDAAVHPSPLGKEKMASLETMDVYGNRLLVEPLTLRTIKHDSIELTDAQSDGLLPQQGKVLKVGPGVTKCSVGDTVLYTWQGTTEWAGLVFMREPAIVCRIMEDNHGSN